MPTITYGGRRVSVTPAAAEHIATLDAEPTRTRPILMQPAKATQGTAAAQTHTAPRAFFTRESREAGCAELRAQNAANRAFWAAQRS